MCNSWLAISSILYSLGGKDRVASLRIYRIMASSSVWVSFFELTGESRRVGLPSRRRSRVAALTLYVFAVARRLRVLLCLRASSVRIILLSLESKAMVCC